MEMRPARMFQTMQKEVILLKIGMFKTFKRYCIYGSRLLPIFQLNVFTNDRSQYAINETKTTIILPLKDRENLEWNGALKKNKKMDSISNYFNFKQGVHIGHLKFRGFVKILKLSLRFRAVNIKICLHAELNGHDLLSLTLKRQSSVGITKDPMAARRHSDDGLGENAPK
nr:hypothetical transcript [Hymenolepis microstoma]